MHRIISFYLSLFSVYIGLPFDYVHVSVLRSLSSVELSRHAVELEKRSIQLSLEEGNTKIVFFFKIIFYLHINMQERTKFESTKKDGGSCCILLF